MESPERQLDLLGIFHYVLAGILVIMSFIPLVYFSFIWHLLRNPDIMRGQDPPPPFLGSIFLAAGIVIVCVGWFWAALIAVAGRFLQLRKHRTYCIVLAALECFFQPFGIILGVFSIVILLRPEVEFLFTAPVPVVPPPLPV